MAKVIWSDEHDRFVDFIVVEDRELPEYHYADRIFLCDHLGAHLFEGKINEEDRRTLVAEVARITRSFARLYLIGRAVAELTNQKNPHTFANEFMSYGGDGNMDWPEWQHTKDEYAADARIYDSLSPMEQRYLDSLRSELQGSAVRLARRYYEGDLKLPDREATNA